MNPYSFCFLKTRISIGQVLAAYGLGGCPRICDTIFVI
jgi:hypothetical protein